MPPVSGAYEYSLGGKWLELLTQIAPGVTRIAVIRDASLTSGTGQFAAIQSAASAFRVELRAVGVEDAGEIDRGVTAFAHSPNGGLIVPGSALATRHRDLIITLAARHKLPALYFDRAFVAAGGLMSYGPRSTCTGKPLATSIASSRERSRLTCRCSTRPNTNS
jgi:putative tryptophan/tyrosine transport system substrate-binding protein